MLFELLLTLATPIFVYFPRIAQLYDLTVTFLDVSESTLLFVLLITILFGLITSLEITLRIYRKIRNKFIPSNSKNLGDSPINSGFKTARSVNRTKSAIKRLFKRARLK